MALRDPVRAVARKHSVPMPAMYSTITTEEFDRMLPDDPHDIDNRSHQSGRSARSQLSQRSQRSQRSSSQQRSRAISSRRDKPPKAPSPKKSGTAIAADRDDDRSHKSARSSSSRRSSARGDSQQSSRGPPPAALGDFQDSFQDASDFDDDGVPKLKQERRHNKPPSPDKRQKKTRRNTVDPDVLRKMTHHSAPTPRGHAETSRKHASGAPHAGGGAPHRVLRPGSRHAGAGGERSGIERRGSERRGSGGRGEEKLTHGQSHHINRSKSDHVPNERQRKMQSERNRERKDPRKGGERKVQSCHDARKERRPSGRGVQQDGAKPRRPRTRRDGGSPQQHKDDPKQSSPRKQRGQAKKDHKKPKSEFHDEESSGSSSGAENMEGKIVAGDPNFSTDDDSDLSSSDSDLSSFSSSDSSYSSFSNSDSSDFSDSDSLSDTSTDSSDESDSRKRRKSGVQQEIKKSPKTKNRNRDGPHDPIVRRGSPRKEKSKIMEGDRHKHSGHKQSSDDAKEKTKKLGFGRKKKSKDQEDKEENEDKKKAKKEMKKVKEKKQGKKNGLSVDVEGGALGYGNDETEETQSVTSSKRMARRGSIAQTAGKMFKKFVKSEDKSSAVLGALEPDYDSDVGDGLGYEANNTTDNAAPSGGAGLGYGDDSTATGRSSSRKGRRGSIVEMAGNWLSKKSVAPEDQSNNNDNILESAESDPAVNDKPIDLMGGEPGLQLHTAGAYLQTAKKDDDCVSVGSSRSKSSKSSRIRRIARRPSFAKLFSSKPSKNTHAQLLNDDGNSDEGGDDSALLF